MRYKAVKDKKGICLIFFHIFLFISDPVLLVIRRKIINTITKLLRAGLYIWSEKTISVNINRSYLFHHRMIEQNSLLWSFLFQFFWFYWRPQLNPNHSTNQLSIHVEHEHWMFLVHFAWSRVARFIILIDQPSSITAWRRMVCSLDKSVLTLQMFKKCYCVYICTGHILLVLVGELLD